MDEGSKTIASAFKGKFTRAPWSELSMYVLLLPWSSLVVGRACEERTAGRRREVKAAVGETGYGKKWCLKTVKALNATAIKPFF